MKGTTVIIFLALLIAGVAGVSASTYGLGVEQGNKRSANYQIAEVGTIIGALMTVVGLGALAYGSFKCRNKFDPRPLGSRDSLGSTMFSRGDF